jgi:type I restriction enzyme S subunit
MTEYKDFKEPEGLPEGWKRIRLGEVCFLSYGKNLPKDKFKDDGKYKVYGANGVIGFYDRYTHSDLTVLVSCRGEYSGVINIAEPYSFITNNSITLLIKNQKTLDTIFLYYVLKNVPRSKIVSGSAQPQVVISDLKDIFILNPPLPEQRKIAEILETVDNAIEKTEKIIEKYKRIKQGLMQDLLTKGIDEKGNIRSEKTHKFKDSPLGKIPEEWEQDRLNKDFKEPEGLPEGWKKVRLGEILKFLKGKTPRKLYDYEEEGMTIYLTPEYLRKNKCDVAFCKKEKTLLANEDIIILWDGSNAGEVFWAEKGAVASTMAKIDINSSDYPIYKKFLYYHLKSNEFAFKYQVKGSGIPHFEKDILNTLNSIFPPLSEQKRIAEILSQIDQAIEKEEQYKEKLERLKQGLMQDLLTGKVRVNHLIEEGAENVST